MFQNPVTYVAPNMSSIIKPDLDNSSDLSVSPVTICAPLAATPPLKEVAPLHIPHLYWHCLTSSNNSEFPVIMQVLIDHGSDAVLISESYAELLRLHRKRLLEPYSAELTMEKNGQKVEIQFSEYMKLQLHDPDSYWTSKSVCAIIAPGLCAPMILGLPFLMHNDIVVDASARTVIDKKCNFDLLHPIPPVPPPPPKKKLHKFFKELQEDRKLMVAKLKMVCHDRLHHTQYKFETVKEVNPIAAIRECIEVLTAQAKLQ